MSVLSFTLGVFGTSILAAFLGALTGLGGGVVIVPVLCILFKMNIHYAIGACLLYTSEGFPKGQEPVCRLFKNNRDGHLPT